MMSVSHGSFVWYTLMTTDTAAAEAFYQGVMGWSAEDAGMADRSYTSFSVAGTPASGLMALPPVAREAGARPRWTGYVAVDDVDEAAARVVQAGGTVHRASEDIPGIGRFAVVADPQDAGFMLFKSARDGQGPDTAPGTPGHAGWRELHAGDRESAFLLLGPIWLDEG
jgi:predicted enzyme related to lactoylglutathione lyase